MIDHSMMLSKMKSQAALLWSQFKSGIDLKRSAVLVFFSVCLSLPAQAAAFNEKFNTDPTMPPGSSVSSFSLILGVDFDFTFTTDGDGGALYL